MTNRAVSVMLTAVGKRNLSRVSISSGYNIKTFSQEPNDLKGLCRAFK